MKNDNSENWQLIDGYNNRYFVNKKGEIKSLNERKQTHLIIKQATCKFGYKYVNLYFKGKYKSVKVHRLVATAFVPNPENKKEINHIDGVKNNNIASNLEWVTRAENVAHAYNIGLKKFPQKSREKISKKIIDTKTGIVYMSILEASEAMSIRRNKLSRWLTGVNPNKSTLKYL